MSTWWGKKWKVWVAELVPTTRLILCLVICFSSKGKLKCLGKCKRALQKTIQLVTYEKWCFCRKICHYSFSDVSIVTLAICGKTWGWDLRIVMFTLQTSLNEGGFCSCNISSMVMLLFKRQLKKSYISLFKHFFSLSKWYKPY